MPPVFVSRLLSCVRSLLDQYYLFFYQAYVLATLAMDSFRQYQTGHVMHHSSGDTLLLLSCHTQLRTSLKSQTSDKMSARVHNMGSISMVQYPLTRIRRSEVDSVQTNNQLKACVV